MRTSALYDSPSQETCLQASSPTTPTTLGSFTKRLPFNASIQCAMRLRGHAWPPKVTLGKVTNTRSHHSLPHTSPNQIGSHTIALTTTHVVGTHSNRDSSNTASKAGDSELLYVAKHPAKLHRQLAAQHTKTPLRTGSHAQPHTITVRVAPVSQDPPCHRRHHWLPANLQANDCRDGRAGHIKLHARMHPCTLLRTAPQ